MKLLLHVCCAPCSVACIGSLMEEGTEPVLFWYNPNIHPYTEYINRRNCLVQYVQNPGLPLVMEDEYGLRKFICTLTGECVEEDSAVSCFDAENRCNWCYRMRMEKAALVAKEKGFDSFSTTLLISPYQKHELIIKEAEKAAEKYQVAFFYRDFRPLFRDGRAKARALGLYMQKYCGCIFSEEEAVKP